MTWDALSCENYPAWIILVAYETRYPPQTSHAKILFSLPLSIRPFASLAFAFSVSRPFRKSFDGVSKICHCQDNKSLTIISANYCMALFPMKTKSENMWRGRDGSGPTDFGGTFTLVSNPFEFEDWLRNLATESWELATKFLVPVAERRLEFF